MVRPFVPTGVVLDESRCRALLYKAIDDNFVDPNPSIGNGFVQKLLDAPPSTDLIESALEQLIIGGTIFAPEWLPPAWYGDLFELGIVQRLPFLPKSELIDVDVIDLATVLGMAADQGTQWSEKRMLLCRRRFEDACRRWDEVKGEAGDRDVEMLLILKQVGLATGIELANNQLAAWNELRSSIQDVQPLVSAIEGYRRVLTCALSHSALSSVPLGVAPTRRIPSRHVDDTLPRQVMLRITCNELHRAPIGRSLRETIEMVQSPAGLAFREKMAEWADHLRTFRVDGFEKVVADVREARRELGFSKALVKTGEYATWIGGGTLLATPVFPPAAVVGGAVTIVGVLSLSGEKLLSYRNRWAMFST